MKKFFILAAVAALAFVGCKSTTSTTSSSKGVTLYQAEKSVMFAFDFSAVPGSEKLYDKIVAEDAESGKYQATASFDSLGVDNFAVNAEVLGPQGDAYNFSVSGLKVDKVSDMYTKYVADTTVASFTGKGVDLAPEFTKVKVTVWNAPTIKIRMEAYSTDGKVIQM